MSTVTQTEPAVGAPAPDFTLPSTAGGTFTLSSQRGEKHVLLAFFPLAFTSVCTTEMCAFGEDATKFESKDTVVYGVSVDHTASQRAFQKAAGFTTPVLSDFHREVSRLYGVLLEPQGFSKRAYFLVDKNGLVRWKHVESDTGHRRENGELLSQIPAL
jgi:peroxiredoxin